MLSKSDILAQFTKSINEPLNIPTQYIYVKWMELQGMVSTLFDLQAENERLKAILAHWCQPKDELREG